MIATVACVLRSGGAYSPEYVQRLAAGVAGHSPAGTRFVALTGVVWRDDAQVVSEIAQKKYGEPERAELVIRKLKGAG